MFKSTILQVSDAEASELADRLESVGYAVLTARPRESLAVLFVNRHIDVVLLQGASDSLMLAAALTAIRPDVPILLLTHEPPDGARPIKGCVCVSDDFEQLVPQLRQVMLRPAV